jgi:hypothetical protein
VFNLVKIDARAVHIQPDRWEPTGAEFLKSDTYSFARAEAPGVAVSVAGGEQEGS